MSRQAGGSREQITEGGGRGPTGTAGEGAGHTSGGKPAPVEEGARGGEALGEEAGVDGLRVGGREGGGEAVDADGALLEPGEGGGVVGGEAVETEVARLAGDLPFPAAADDGVTMENGVQEIEGGQFGAPAPGHADEDDLAAFADAFAAVEDGLFMAAAFEVEGELALERFAFGEVGANIAQAGGEGGAAAWLDGIDAGDLVTAAGEDLGGEVADRAEAGDEDAGGGVGGGGVERAHAHAHEAGENGDLGGEAGGERRDLIAARLLKFRVGTGSEDDVADAQVGDGGAEFLDLENAGVAGFGGEVLAEVTPVEFGAGADKRDEGAAANVVGLDRATLNRHGL